MKKKQENKTLDEAKKDVMRRIQRGESYREIVKTRYRIDGIIKKFSISEVSKIKQEFSGQTINSKDKDSNAALVFELFAKGESQCDIVVKTHLSPDYVSEKYEQYNQMRYAGRQEMFLKMAFEMAKWITGREARDIVEVQYYLENAACHLIEHESGILCDACTDPAGWKKGKLSP